MEDVFFNVSARPLCGVRFIREWNREYVAVPEEIAQAEEYPKRGSRCLLPLLGLFAMRSGLLRGGIDPNVA